MPRELPLSPGTLATQCYSADPQVFYNEMFEKGSALVGDLTGIIISATEPDPEDRDKAWLKLSSAGGPPAISLPLVWFNGKWVARHPDAPEGDARRLWIGTEAALVTYDGGSSGTVSDVSGPMWEVDHTFDRRFPIGPDTTSPAIAVGATGGSETHTITQAELPDVDLTLTVWSGQADNLDNDTHEILTNPQVPTNPGNNVETLPVPLGGSGTAFDMKPPYVGIYVIRRTARTFYTS